MIQLTVQVNDITTVMSLYGKIRVYSSDSYGGTYVFLTDITLVAGTVDYIYNHTAGTPDTWYKCAYYNSTSGAQSTYSDPTQGESPIYHIVTYPDEYEFSSSEQLIIRKIRRLIGDIKGLNRLYIEGDLACSSILEDDKTIDLGAKGWPLYVKINSTEYIALDNPIVQGYQYLTFSGTLNSGVQNDVIEIWFNTFKFSDREVYEAYGDAMIPAGLTSSSVTQDHLILQAAIDLLESLIARNIMDDGASIRDDQNTYDPSPGLRAAEQLLARLKKRLDELVKQYLFYGIEGVLID
jgi:hypothetical protein